MSARPEQAILERSVFSYRRDAKFARDNILDHSLGCYDETRFGSREEMIAEIMSVFEQSPTPTLADAL